MYQSGCDAADTWAGLYGPHSQIGLIWTRPPSAAMTPKTTKNRPVALPANVGKSRLPTTLCSVRPGPANWVCFCLTRISRCTAIRASRIAGMQQHVDDVEAADDQLADEVAAEHRAVRPGPDHRDRQHDRADDAEPGAREQVVGEASSR